MVVVANGGGCLRIFFFPHVLYSIVLVLLYILPFY